MLSLYKSIANLTERFQLFLKNIFTGQTFRIIDDFNYLSEIRRPWSVKQLFLIKFCGPFACLTTDKKNLQSAFYIQFFFYFIGRTTSYCYWTQAFFNFQMHIISVQKTEVIKQYIHCGINRTSSDRFPLLKCRFELLYPYIFQSPLFDTSEIHFIWVP